MRHNVFDQDDTDAAEPPKNRLRMLLVMDINVGGVSDVNAAIDHVKAALPLGSEGEWIKLYIREPRQEILDIIERMEIGGW
jgi:hypothetical protein